MPTTPTVVLVHGAFADASSWNGAMAVADVILEAVASVGSAVVGSVE
jgi:hypothetical protein